MDEPSDEPPLQSSETGAIELIDPDDTLDEPARHWLECQVAKVAAGLCVRGEVRVRLMHDAEMAAAHERHKGITGPTDVLTFDLSDEGGLLDVDLLVCVDEARRRAGEFGHEVRAEVLLYIVHGVLHCMGHDDHDPDDARRMHEAEDALLRDIGVGAVYTPGEREIES
jgi:probable rRNA maturation factor